MNPGTDGPQVGKVIAPFTNKTVFSKAKHEEIRKCLNPFLSMDVVFGNKPGFAIGTSKATITIPDPRIWGAASSATNLNMHPFKIYPTGTTSVVAGVTCIGYNVRVGLVDIRPYFHSIGQAGSLFTANDVYAATIIPTNTDVSFGPSDYIPSPLPSATTFFLDPTAEIISSVNYGAMYAFYIRIDPDTDNGGAWDGAATVIASRFSIGTPTDPFPGIPNGITLVDGIEYIRIGILQLTAATSPYMSVDGMPGDGLILQMIHEHQTNRFPAGQSGRMGFTRCGDWSDAAVSSVNRYFYPGDLIQYNSGTPLDPFNGFYLSLEYQNIGAGPPSGVGAWDHWPDGT